MQWPYFAGDNDLNLCTPYNNGRPVMVDLYFTDKDDVTNIN